jgi:hypothetical protein
MRPFLEMCSQSSGHRKAHSISRHYWLEGGGSRVEVSCAAPLLLLSCRRECLVSSRRKAASLSGLRETDMLATSWPSLRAVWGGAESSVG